MEDSEKPEKSKSRVMLFVAAGAFAVFCLLTALVMQMMMVAEELLQAEAKAESVWDNYPELVDVRTVFSECSKQATEDHVERQYLSKDQCRHAAMGKARAVGLEDKASAAFQTYEARVEELKQNVKQPWPLSVVSGMVMQAVGDLEISK